MACTLGRNGLVAGKTGIKTGIVTATSPKGGARLPLGAHPGNTGGKKGRSGRKPSEVVALARSLTDQYGLVQRLALIASGQPVLQFQGTDKEGKPEIVVAPARAADQIRAIELLLNRGWGKVPETIQGDVDVHYVVEVPHRPESVQAWQKRYGPLFFKS
jgi:hypothetical protein